MPPWTGWPPRATGGPLEADGDRGVFVDDAPATSFSWPTRSPRRPEDLIVGRPPIPPITSLSGRRESDRIARIGEPRRTNRVPSSATPGPRPRRGWMSALRPSPGTRPKSRAGSRGAGLAPRPTIPRSCSARRGVWVSRAAAPSRPGSNPRAAGLLTSKGVGAIVRRDGRSRAGTRPATGIVALDPPRGPLSGLARQGARGGPRWIEIRPREARTAG